MNNHLRSFERDGVPSSLYGMVAVEEEYYVVFADRGVFVVWHGCSGGRDLDAS
jgi:hypothetical protein